MNNTEYDDLELSCSSSDFEHSEDAMTVTINSAVNTQPYQFEPEAEGATAEEEESAPTDQDERRGNNHWFVSMFSCLFVARSRSRSKL